MYSPWTNVEVQNRNLETQLRIYLQNPFTNWSFQTTMFAYARNTTPLFQHKFSPTKLSYTSYSYVESVQQKPSKNPISDTELNITPLDRSPTISPALPFHHITDPSGKWPYTCK